MTAYELSQLLTAGKVTSVQLVEIYLHQIDRYDGYLHSVICTAPKNELLERAKALDAERKAGLRGSLLHGIPILVKDNIATDPSLGMDTTAGSTAFVGSKPKKSADLVERLLEAGMIIIGKANLSELSYYKGKELLCGWSAVGGQGQSAYVRGGIDPEDTFAGHSNPGGSSSGSGISVSAGLAPLSIGTETQGSLILPSARAALYTIKPTIGLVSGQGIVPVCTVFDSAGPMTKSVMDEALLLEALMNDSAKSKISNRTQGGLGDVVQGANWENLKVGVLDPVKWKWSDKYLKPNKQNEDQMNAAYASAYAKIKTLAKSFHENLPLPNGDDMKIGDEGAIDTVINYQLLEDFQTYTSGLAHNPNNIHTIADIVEYNKRNAAVELPAEYPNQEKLEDVLKVNISKEYFEEALALLRKVSRDDGIDKMMKDYDIDVIIGPAESWMTGMASASGYPIASLPLGYLESNGCPFAMAALTTAYGEATLLTLQAVWGETFGPRQVPDIANFEGKAT